MAQAGVANPQGFNIVTSQSHPVDNNNLPPGGDPHGNTSPRIPPTQELAGPLITHSSSTQVRDPGPSYLQAPTQRLDDPTQPFLAFGLDLNLEAECEDRVRFETSTEVTSPQSATMSRSRSRSRSRSPTRGKDDSTPQRRNSSPKQTRKSPRACPAGPYHTV